MAPAGLGCTVAVFAHEFLIGYWYGYDGVNRAFTPNFGIIWKQVKQTP